ncbi:MAG TPA: ACP S-malonyltransferase [Tepidisphaeraceae bacterium]|nr:ACP S-malonyltransferase [Tepidisphaeraceae bacterium]
MFHSTFILCPGQGAQAVGMGRDFYESHESARKIFGQASGILGFDLASVCFNGPEDRLNQTDISQPAIYVTSIISMRCAIEACTVSREQVTAWAGLSLGEYTALHLAGVFGFEDGLRLVAARGRYMQEAAIANPSGMVAIMGADEAAVLNLCETSAQGEVLAPANFNAPGQIVVSGTNAACQRVLAAAERAGFKAVALKVTGAFHSPLMAPAADHMREELAKVQFNAPRQPVYSNVTGMPHQSPESIKARLIEQIVKPVRWEQTMQALIAADPAARFIELAPGRTLAGLAKRISRRLPVESVAVQRAPAKTP